MKQTRTGIAASTDELLFDAEADDAEALNKTAWKVMIADDEPDVHLATKLVLKEFSFNDRRIEFLDAYSGKETCDLLRRHPDTAVIFLDVVMETEDAGLRTVRRIREELGNHLVRIILRTGQPGQAPEEDVVVNYHINDYKSKAEMTTRKLFTSIVSALRSYQDLLTIEASRRGLVKVLDASSNMDFRSRNLFVSGLLMQLGSLLDIGDSSLLLIRRGEADRPDTIMAACGDFDAFIGEPASSVLDAESLSLIAGVFEQRETYEDAKRAIYLVPLPNLSDVVVFVGGTKKISETALALVEIFCLKVELAYENFEFVEESRKDQGAEIALLAKVTGHASYLTLSHLFNRGRLSRSIAQRLRDISPPRSIDGRLPAVIERAAMLADVGNACLPDTLLEQTGSLSPEDMATVRRHPQQGAEMIRQATAEVPGGRVIALACEIAGSHHENFDGTGYPQGLSGTGIPLSGRITAVADRYLAMTSPRPWRPALDHSEAVSLIRSAAGTHFDPKVVEAFLQVAGTFRNAAPA